jgi:hypothetical protein
MNKKMARYGFYFYIVNMILLMLFPKKLYSNLYYLGGFAICSIILLFFIFRKKDEKAA